MSQKNQIYPACPSQNEKKWIISDEQWQIKKKFNVLALENILVALTREIGDGPCFLYIKFSWIGVNREST